MKIVNLNSSEQKGNYFIYLERYVNEGSKTYSALSDRFSGNKKYHPVHGVKRFKVPCLLVPRAKVAVFLDDPSPNLAARYLRSDNILMPVHPEIFQDEDIPFIQEIRQYPLINILVEPTASTRTVMAISDAHFIKLHYPRYISRFVRPMPRNVIENSISVSRGLRNINLTNFGFLPETIGIAYGDGPSSWGFIIREIYSRPSSAYKPFLIPFFSLYSQDINSPNDLPLLVQLIEYHKADPQDFIISKIMEPVIAIWCACIRQAGFLLEMHGENTLLELNKNYSPSRIVYRDFDISIDLEVRKSLSLHNDFAGLGHSKYEPEKKYSLSYDIYIGHHLFDYIAKMAERHYGIPPITFHSACQKIFARCFPDADRYFVDQIFYYANEPRLDSKYDLIAIAEKPKWR